jgi:hypothetical protein
VPGAAPAQPRRAELRHGANRSHPATEPACAWRRPGACCAHQLNPLMGTLTGRTGWPDPLHRRQESPARRRHATAPVQVSREWAKERSSWSDHYRSVLVCGLSRSCQQLRRRRSQISAAGERHRLAALLYFAAVPGPWITGSGFRIYLSDLGGAKGIRTPDLLHAISRQHVHPRPSMQVTVPGRAHESSGIRAGCGTFLLYRAEPAPLRTPADTRPVESLRIYRAGYPKPRTPSASQGQHVQL